MEKKTPQGRDLATRLRELRLQKGLRQKDLAETLGLAQTTIANYEQGSRFPDEKTLYGLADYFRVTLDYLLGRSEVNLLNETLAYSRAFHTQEGEELAPLEPLAERYLEVLLGGDREAAGRLVLEAFERGTTIQELYINVFERTLKEVGRRWAESSLEVGTEHFFTASTEAIMSQLYPHLMAGDRPRSGRTCLAFSVCGEFHQVGARMVGDLLEGAGWRCYFLGSNLCNEDILKAAAEHTPDLVALSATMYLNVDSVARLVRALRAQENLKGLKILVGGRPFILDPELWRRVGADGAARTAVDAVALAGRLVVREPVHALLR
jgi:methanogenic corrinoid protein MtbC1